MTRNEYERQPGTGGARRHFDRGSERHGGSRAEAKTPPAYLIAETDVTDRAAFQKYAEKVPETLAPFRGSFHYVVRGGKTQALEGQPPKSIVVLAFDSTEKALAWYNSPAYEAIKPIRQGASVSRMFMAEGLPPQ
jgi:uncharacterized protein (DUF1330 family)